MNLCFIINRKYIKLLIVVVKSIADTNSGSANFRLFIVHSELEKEDLTYIRESIPQEYKLIDIKVDRELFINAPLLRSDFSLEGYYKLLLPYVLPIDIDKVLYMDCDIIIKKRLDDLYEKDLQRYYYAAVPDRMINRKMKKYVSSLGIPKEGKYYNTGVLLMNLNELRKVDDLTKYLKYIEEKGDTFKYHDQQVINYFYSNKILALEEKYNYTATYNEISDVFKHLIEKNVPTIIHFSGMKPWYRYYFGSFYEEFWRYAFKYINIEDEHKGKRGFRLLKYILGIYNSYRRKQIMRKYGI